MTHLINIVDRHDGVGCEDDGDPTLHVFLNGGGIVEVVEGGRVVVDIRHRDGDQCGGSGVPIVHTRHHLLRLYKTIHRCTLIVHRQTIWYRNHKKNIVQ